METGIGQAFDFGTRDSDGIATVEMDQHDIVEVVKTTAILLFGLCAFALSCGRTIDLRAGSLFLSIR